MLRINLANYQLTERQMYMKTIQQKQDKYTFVGFLIFISLYVLIGLIVEKEIDLLYYAQRYVNF